MKIESGPSTAMPADSAGTSASSGGLAAPADGSTTVPGPATAPGGAGAGRSGQWGPPTPPEVRRLYRDPASRVVAGVAAGLAEHLGMRTVLVRVIFVGLLAANGLGALLYAAFWAVLPARPQRTPRRRASMLQRLGLVALAAGVITVRVQLGGFGDDLSLVALLALIAFGAGT